MQNTATLTNPLGLDVIDDVTGYAPLHEVTSPEHADALAADMLARGWNGAPIVVLPDYARAFTGVHRLAAAEQAGLPVPGINAEDLLNACGIDLWERREEFDELEDTLIALFGELPADIRDAYGLDMH